MQACYYKHETMIPSNCYVTSKLYKCFMSWFGKNLIHPMEKLGKIKGSCQMKLLGTL